LNIAKHDLEPSPRLGTPGLINSPAQTPTMSQLATPTIGFGTAPRTPLAVVPEAQAKRGWFEKAFSGKPVGVSLLPLDIGATADEQYYELISTYDCSTTREECFKIFNSLGAAVQVEDSENWGNLVITQHEVRGRSSLHPALQVNVEEHGVKRRGLKESRTKERKERGK